MAAAPRLIVRNLTSTPFSIKRVEQFEDPNSLQSRAKSYFFKSKSTTNVLLTPSQVGSHAQSFNYQDLDIALAPFEASTLNPPTQDPAAKDDLVLSTKTLRLTLETATGERYRTDSNPSYTQKSSQLLTPLSSNPSTTLSALFRPSKPTPHLIIHTNHLPNYKKWMEDIPDSLPISALSIPGTHNSHTHYRALPSVRCQVVDVATQLENGIRFLDIRIQPAHATDVSKKDFYLVHGAFPASLKGTKYFEPVLQSCYDFLEENPSETILISLKREGPGGATDEHVARVLDEHYISTRKEMWYLEPRIPYLKDVRRKLVLIRRYKTSSSSFSPTSVSAIEQEATATTKTITTTHPPGLDCTPWPDNPSSSLFPDPPSAPLIALQDFYAVMSPLLIPTKLQHTTTHLARAAETSHPISAMTTRTQDAEIQGKQMTPAPGPLYLNFLSASNFWRRACWPENIARIINRGVEEWLCGGHGLSIADSSSVEATHGETRKLSVDNGGGRGEGRAGGRHGSGASSSVGGGGGGEGGGDVRKSTSTSTSSAVVQRKSPGDCSTGIVVMDCVGEHGDWDIVRLVIGMNMGVLMRFAQRQRQRQT